jgi:alpha-glucosidase (family GH31 glycosyl hydrolase)
MEVSSMPCKACPDFSDNNEYYLHDDEFLARNEFSAARTAPTGVGRATVGLLGRMVNTEMMAKVSHDALISLHPHRRPYVLTRSGNISTFKYATGTWSGDNETSWRNLRGSVAIQLNSGISLLQSTGADVGGFGGPVPCPELFVRWVQLGVTHSRFCIHAYKPTVADPSGAAATNTPWMHPAVLPVIRNAIKWRYRYLPYLNALNWRSHLYAEPPNAWLGWGEFESDPKVYAPAQLEGYDAWFGAGQLLTIPALHEGETSRTVYLPRSGPHDTAVYYDLHPPHGGHSAGSTITLATPLEHIGLLAREGAALLSGRDVVTITAREGAPRTTPDGVSTRLVDEGGVVALDDYRAVEIFPGASGRQYAYTRTWVEDDGIAAEPARAVVEITYSSVTDADADDQVVVRARFLEHEFKPLWGTRLHILLPVGDTRTVLGAVPMARDGRTAFVVNVEVP